MNEDNIFGCFVSCPASVYDSNETEKDSLIKKVANSELCKLFREYIWGVKGICNILKEFKHKDYGND